MRESFRYFFCDLCSQLYHYMITVGLVCGLLVVATHMVLTPTCCSWSCCCRSNGPDSLMLFLVLWHSVAHISFRPMLACLSWALHERLEKRWPYTQDSLKLFAQELNEKVQGLHEQRMRQLSLERECSRLRQEVDRLAVLQPLLEGQQPICLQWFCTISCPACQKHHNSVAHLCQLVDHITVCHMSSGWSLCCGVIFNCREISQDI